MTNGTSVSPIGKPGSQREALAATVPFLLGALLSVLNLLNAGHPWIPLWVGTGLAGVALLAFLIGLLKGLPRWSLPYAGVMGLNLSWILTHKGTFMGLNTRAGLLDPLLGWIDRLILTLARRPGPWIVRAILGIGIDWIALLGLAASGVLIIAAFQPLRPLYSRVRDDWTLLSFGLYGATVMAVSYAFEDYPSARYPFIFVSSLILAAGAWVYMQAGRTSEEKTPGRRALALLTAMVVAMILGAAGKGIIYASPDWPYPRSFTWQSEALHAVVVWAWVMAVVLAPALLTLLPRQTRPA